MTVPAAQTLDQVLVKGRIIFEQCQQEVLFLLEVDVEGTLANARLGTDIVDSGLLVALAGGAAPGRLDQLLPLLGLDGLR